MRLANTVLLLLIRAATPTSSNASATADSEATSGDNQRLIRERTTIAFSAATRNSSALVGVLFHGREGKHARHLLALRKTNKGGKTGALGRPCLAGARFALEGEYVRVLVQPVAQC